MSAMRPIPERSDKRLAFQKPLEDIHPAESSRDFVEQRFFRLFERFHGHLARDRLIEEFSQGVPALKIVQQILERNSRPRKQGVPFITSGSTTIIRSAIIAFILCFAT